MKSADNQQKRKAFYMDAVYSSTPYTGTRTQPGYAGNASGSKLSKRVLRLGRKMHSIRGGGL